MSRKNFFIPIVVAVISIVFVIVSLLVFVTRGKPSLIKKKLKIGALILTMTAMFTVHSNCRIACYSPSPDEMLFSVLISEEYYYQGEINLDLSHSNVISGKIEPRDGSIFSFALINENDEIKQSDNISAFDGVFDERTEEFELTINNGLLTGRYKLIFYIKPMEEQTIDNYYQSEHYLNITNE